MNYYQVGQTLVLSVNNRECSSIANGEMVLKKKYRFLKKYPWANGKHTTYLFHDTSCVTTSVDDIVVNGELDTRRANVIFVCGIYGSGKTTFINKCFSDKSIFTEEIDIRGKDIGGECRKHNKTVVFSFDISTERDIEFIEDAILRLGINATIINIICENGMPNVVTYLDTYQPCNIIGDTNKQFVIGGDLNHINVINEYGKGFTISNKNYKYASSYFKGRTRPFE